MNKVKAVFKTDRGKVRAHNEDRVGVFKNHSGNYIAIVADGMGGHNAGDVASEMTLTKLQEAWEQTEEFSTPELAEAWLTEQITKINTLIFEHAQENKACEGMGTTIVAAICTTTFTTIAHIGDSRCYMLNDLGFNQLTEDHSLVNELVRSGEISQEEAERHPRKNMLLRALGTDASIQIDLKTITFEYNDLLLLCSDGLSNKVSKEEIATILSQAKELEEKAAALIQLANDNGGEDNITLIIVNNEEKLGDTSC